MATRKPLAKPAFPHRGEIWLADLNPTRGHEQAGRRPVLILSVDLFNRGPSGLVILIPLTTTNRGIPWHVSVSPPEGGLDQTSFALCDAIRSVSRDRLEKKLGKVSSQILSQVVQSLQVLLDL